MRTTLLSLLVSALPLLLGACAVTIELPKDFLVLGEQDDASFRAVTGDDARVWIREFDDPNAADRAFWRQAIEYDFTQRGYRIVAKGEAKDGRGASGDWFECTADVRGERIGYLVVVWVQDQRIRVLEFAAREPVYEARVAGVRAALATLRG